MRQRDRKLPVHLLDSIADKTTMCHPLQNKKSRYRQCETLGLLLCCTFLSHFLTEVHCYRGATYFLIGPQQRGTLGAPPPLPPRLTETRSVTLFGRRRAGGAPVVRRRCWAGGEVDTGVGGGLRALHLPAHLLREEGQVLPQLRHTHL